MPRPAQPITEEDYAIAAERYARSLRMEHFMEATPQATQRKITVESFDLVHAARPDVQVFNELLVQYPRPGYKKLGQVVPDNMVVVHPEPIPLPLKSYDLTTQPARPFWVLEYVSKENWRKDYEESFEKYEKDLQVPYYMIYYPDIQDLSLYHLVEGEYVAQPPNGNNRYHVPELEMEFALVGDWVRFWFRGELLALPAELQADLQATRKRAADEKQRADDATKRADALAVDLERERKARDEMAEELRRLRTQLGQGET